jgi:hypothetical protein
MCEVRKTSRKDPTAPMAAGNPQRPYAGPLSKTRERMRWSDTRGDARDRDVRSDPSVMLVASCDNGQSEIPCRVNSCPASERSDASIPLITVKPTPAASTKDEATAGG